MNCPLCGSIDTGKVGTAQYYCWNCLIEFRMEGAQGFTAYFVDEEGSLISISEPPEEGQPENSVLVPRI